MRATPARATAPGWVTLTAVLTLVAAAPRPARAGSVRGVVAAEGYALTYGGGEQTSATFGLDLRLDASELTSWELAAHVDGELRVPVNGDLYDPSVPAYRLERLSAGLDPVQGWVALAGREWIVDVPTASVDGLTLGYRWQAFRVGGFGGLEPNPYDQTFDGKFMTGGGFVGIQGEQGGADAGFVASFYDGEADRESLTSQGRWSPTRELDVFGSLRLDLGVADQATRLGSLAVGGDWRATPTFRLGGSFTTYRYLLRPASLDPAVLDAVSNPQRESIEGRARYELSHDLYTRARLSYRLRQAVPSYEVRILPEGAPLDGTAGEVYIDDQGRSYTLAATTTDESSFGGGLAFGGRRLASLPLRWEVAYTGVTGFGRNDHEGAVSAGFDVGGGASLDLGAGVDLRNREETGSDVGGFARAELFWMIDRDWFALASYEATMAEGDLDHALLAKVGYRIRPPAGSATASRAADGR